MFFYFQNDLKLKLDHSQKIETQTKTIKEKVFKKRRNAKSSHFYNYKKKILSLKVCMSIHFLFDKKFSFFSLLFLINFERQL